MQLLKEKIRKDFPEFSIKAIKVLDTGWHHDAVEVNGSIIFLIPHHAYGQDITPDKVHREVELLRFLKDKLPVNIPDPQYVAADESYFGYPKLDGVLLDDVIGIFTHENWEQLKVDWVAIASTLHENVSVETVRSLGVPDFKPSDSQTIKRILDIPDIDKDVMDFALEMIRQLEAYDPDPESYVFIHYDMQPRNIIINPETMRIVGLIDWTESCIGPLSREFSVHEWMQGNLLSEVASLYEEKTGLPVDTKQARMLYGIDELSGYVEYIEAEDFHEATKYLRRIKQLIVTESQLG